VAIGERRLERRHDEGPSDSEQRCGRKGDGERSARSEEERPRRDAACGDPKRGAAPDADDETVAGHPHGDRAERDERRVETDDRARDVELFAERGERRPERVEQEAPEPEHPVAEARELVALEAKLVVQRSSPGRSENITESRRRPSGWRRCERSTASRVKPTFLATR
jgi:hypothetical protein